MSSGSWNRTSSDCYYHQLLENMWLYRYDGPLLGREFVCRLKMDILLISNVVVVVTSFVCEADIVRGECCIHC